MKIDFEAFKNCLSLKEIRFKDMLEPVFIDILTTDNLPDDYKIIVPDKFYKLTRNLYHPLRRGHIYSYTTLKQEELKKQIQDIVIYLAICHLEKVQNVEHINEIIEYLKNEYQINEQKMLQVKEVFNV